MRSCLRIDVPAELDIYKASERLVKQLARYPHLCLKMEPAAQDYFDGYSAMFNIRGKQLRRDKSADKSAEEGIAPWKNRNAGGLFISVGRHVGGQPRRNVLCVL